MTLRPISSSLPVSSLFKLLWSQADHASKRFVFATLLLAFASSAVSGLAPVVLKEVIDILELSKGHRPFLSALDLVLLYAIVHLASKSLSEVRDMFNGRADQRMQRQVSHRLFQHVMSLSLRFHLEAKTGGLTQILTNGLMGYRMVLHHLMTTILPIIVEFLIISGVLLLFGHAVFLAILGISILLYTAIFSASVARVGRPARAVSEAKIHANALFVDSILNYEAVKYLGAESQMHARFDEALKRCECRWRRLYRRKMENGLLVAGILAISLGVVAYIAARKVQQGSMTVGEFVLVNAYVLQISQPLEMLGLAFRDIAEGNAWIARMHELFRHEPDAAVHVRSPRRPALRGAPEVVFEQVSYSYRPGRPAVTGVSFILPAAKTVAIVGSSGCGKSSLIRLLVRMVDPTEGTIYLNGAPLPRIPISELRRAVAVVPQQITLFDESIAYNIGIGREGSTEEEIVVAARVAEIHDFITRLPNGYRTKVGERGLKLSGGEKQRLAIARAAIRKPLMFIFDEVTSSLDLSTERAVLHNLLKLSSSTTTLIIAHRLSTIADVDQIIVMDQGGVIEDGSHAALMQRSGVYAELWNAQQGHERPRDPTHLVHERLLATQRKVPS